MIKSNKVVELKEILLALLFENLDNDLRFDFANDIQICDSFLNNQFDYKNFDYLENLVYSHTAN